MCIIGTVKHSCSVEAAVAGEVLMIANVIPTDNACDDGLLCWRHPRSREAALSCDNDSEVVPIKLLGSAQ